MQQEDKAEHMWSISQIVFKWKTFSLSPSYLIFHVARIAPLWQTNGFVLSVAKLEVSRWLITGMSLLAWRVLFYFPYSWIALCRQLWKRLWRSAQWLQTGGLIMDGSPSLEPWVRPGQNGNGISHSGPGQFSEWVTCKWSSGNSCCYGLA